MQLKISFDDHATTTFEYDREEAALEAYLDEHPEEREAALRQEEEVNSVVDAVNDDPTKDSPRHSESETLKSNTVIGQPTGKIGSGGRRSPVRAVGSTFWVAFSSLLVGFADPANGLSLRLVTKSFLWSFSAAYLSRAVVT